MKATVLLTTIVILISAASNTWAGGGSIYFKEGSEPDGFRGIKWGTRFQTLKGMTLIDVDRSDKSFYGGIKRYTKRGDKLRIGGAHLSKIVYGFWQGQLFYN